MELNSSKTSNLRRHQRRGQVCSALIQPHLFPKRARVIFCWTPLHQFFLNQVSSHSSSNHKQLEIMPTSHIILLLQPGDEKTRTYSDYDSLISALTGLCSVFEETFRKKNPGANVEYDIDEVVEFFEEFEEVLFFVYQEQICHYLPRDFEWIKQRLEEFGHGDSSVTEG